MSEGLSNLMVYQQVQLSHEGKCQFQRPPAWQGDNMFCGLGDSGRVEGEGGEAI